jgi:hypothetical protein
MAKYDKKQNLIGVKFHHFTVIKKLPSNKKHGRWQCLCDCGNIRTLVTNEINRKTRKTCGCSLRNNIKNGSYNWNGHGDIHGKVWSNIRRGAISRGHAFRISIQYAWNLFLKQDKKCALSGLSIKFPITVRDNENGGRTASLDRINSKKGYIKNNIQWVHKNINLAKQELSDAEFIELCNTVSKFQKRKLL